MKTFFESFRTGDMRWRAGLALVLLSLAVARSFAANVPVGFTLTSIPGPTAGLWGKPVGATFDAAGRMFVWERIGKIWMKGPTETNFSLVFDIGEEKGDEGLLGFAIDPNFTANGYIYLLYVVDRHHLLYYGTTNYDPNISQEDEATIGRLTRYTCVASNDFKSVDPASRLVLLGESKTNGLPICGTTHTVGAVVFGQDGTLLITTGDAASFTEVDVGGSAAGSSYAPQALSDGIIRPKEDVGAYRSQLVDCLNGKLLRLDPVTGNGLPSNPYYDPANPRAAKSRVWALGLRNPFRMTRRPDSGSHNPADGDPGAFYISDVGWDTKECLKVVTGPRQNFGWPLYEGLSLTPTRGGDTYNIDVNNLDATNAVCGGYFSFRQLLKPDTTNAALFPPFTNPCNSSLKITNAIPQFIHRRASLDWEHGNALTRTPTYDASGNGTIANVGAGGSPVSGTQFPGNCSIAGTWYVGTAYPVQYQNKYFHSEWGQQFIKMMSFDTNNRPTAVNDFASATGPVVCMVQHPFDECIYYVVYDGDTGTVWRLSYTGNRTPVAVAGADQSYGPGPLTVQFTGSGSSDPDAQTLTYLWNFGDGTPTTTAPNPSHIFSSPGNIRTNYVVTLTVTDTGSLSASATLGVSLNNTPPSVTITSPTNGTLYSVTNVTPFNLAATVTDAESSDAQLKYEWQTVLHHNDHNHVEGISTNHTSTTVVEPAGCDGINMYYYRVLLTVTDPNGLATVREVQLFPNCGATDTPPTISDIPNQGTAINVPTAPVPFTIGDAQVVAANLQLSAVSSNAALVPPGNIVFNGYGANRTLTLTPAASLTGTTEITVTVNDGPNNTSDTFLLTVSGTNTLPSISAIADQITGDGVPTAANPFTVSDTQTAPGSLLLSGSAANATLVPSGNIFFGGSGSNRTVTVTPAAGQTGTTLVTVVVSDGQLSASNSYTLTVTNAPVSSKSFTNTAAVTIPDSGAGSPYPSTINVTGMGGVVSNVTVTLRNFTHSWGSDVDVLLVGPAGQKVVLMSDCGQFAANNVTLTLSDAAATSLPTANLASGTFKPTNISDGSAGGDNFPAPAPAAPFGAALTNFIGTAPNGTWSLYVFDDGAGDLGSLGGGWSLSLVTKAGVVSNTAPSIIAISNQVVVVNNGTGALPFTINDAETAASNLVVTVFTSNSTLVPTNRIVLGGSGSSRTVSVTPASNQLGSATISLSVSDGSLVASNSFGLTVNPAVLSVTENSASRGYGQTNPVLSGSLSGLQAGDNITASFSSAATTNSPVGSYAISFTLSDSGNKLGNYSILTNNGTLSVTNAPLSVSANSSNKMYGTTMQPVGYNVSGLLNGDSVTNVALTSLGSVSNAPVSSYAIVVGGVSGVGLTNYTVGASNGVLTVTQAVLVATADNVSRAYAQPNPPFTISYIGFVNGEGTNVLDVLPLASSAATNTSASGVYLIAVTGGSDDNYALARVGGTLTITVPGPVAINSVAFVSPTSFRIAGVGDANVNYKVQASFDLIGWSEIGTAPADSGGAFEFVDGTAGGFDVRYYRIATP